MVIPLLSVMRGQCDSRPTVTVPACGGTKVKLPDERGTCVNSLPKAAPEILAAGTQILDLLIASRAPHRYATEPHCGDSGKIADKTKVECVSVWVGGL